MLKSILICTALFIIMMQNCEAQTGMPAHRDARWKSDIDFLGEKLAQVHPRFRNCGLSAGFDSARIDIKSRISSLSDAQIVVEIQKLLASAGDGHTMLYPFGMKKGTLLRIPLMFWLFDDGLFILRAPQDELIGKKVISIGGIKTEELLRKLEPYISHDNYQQFRWAAPFYCTLTDFLAAAGALKNRDTAEITIAGDIKYSFAAMPVDPDDLEIKLVPAQTGEAPEYILHRNENFRIEEIRPDILYVAVNAMNDSPEKTLQAFGIELRERLKSHKKMILDLRYNNGGEALKADELFKTCVAYDTEGGRMAVLIGRMTFSAAQTFASRIDQWTNAFFVGEKTGSKPNHYGNERSFKLPYSGLMGTISSGYNQPVSANDSRMYITPGIEVEVNSQDFFSGRDPEIEAAIKELEKNTVK